MNIKMSEWAEVSQGDLQHWLNTASPDYTLRHEWGDDWMVCYHRRSGEPFAYQRNKDRRCFVHPEFKAFVTPTPLYLNE